MPDYPLAAGATSAERVNNAIYKLERASFALSKGHGTRKAIKQLADHWNNYWSGARKTEALPSPKRLQRYVQWYARGWALLPPALRAECPDPRLIDVSFGAAAEDQVRAILEGAEASAQATSSAAAYVRDESAKLAAEIADSAERLANKATSAFREIGVWAIVLGGLYIYSQRRRA